MCNTTVAILHYGIMTPWVNEYNFLRGTPHQIFICKLDAETAAEVRMFCVWKKNLDEWTIGLLSLMFRSFYSDFGRTQFLRDVSKG